MRNSGLNPDTMTAAELARQALVIYVEGGKAAGEMMDEIEKMHWEQLKREADDEAGIPDTLASPEGMSLAEGSLGVIS